MQIQLLLFHVLSHVQPAKKKQRAQVIEFFIDVARECFNIGNFNSLMAIICKREAKGCDSTHAVTAVFLSIS